MLPFCSTTNELPQLKQTANGPIRATGSPVLLQTGQVISVIAEPATEKDERGNHDPNTHGKPQDMPEDAHRGFPICP